MKNLHKKKVNVLGKKVPVLMLAMVVVIGLGTAALLPYFGQITGMATVSQSVTLNGNSIDDMPLYFQFHQENVIAGKGFIDGPYILDNNADESVVLSIDSECSSSVDSGVQCDGVTTEHYNVQTYGLYGQIYGNDTLLTETSHKIKVLPGVKEVTYQVDFPNYAEQVDVEISREDGNNYHVKYKEGDGFYYKDLSKSGDLESIEGLEEFREGSYDNGVVTFTVKRNVGYDQDFSAHLMGSFSNFDSAVTKTAGEKDNEENGGGTEFYDDTSTEHHEIVDFTALESLTLEAGESAEFSVGNDFAINLRPADYTVTTTVNPAA